MSSAQKPSIKVVYRDGGLLAAHKPSGIPTYRESRSGNADGCKEILEEQLNQRLFPVHRIDADTSGLVLFALDSKSAASMIRLFKEHKIRKTYVAWCIGEVPERGTYRASLKKNKSEETETARTEFERIKFDRGFSFVRVSPLTGRFHQIRRHFEMAGNALVGDPLYGNSEKWASFFQNGAFKNSTPRLMLQAESLEFIHPITRKNMLIKTKEALL